MPLFDSDNRLTADPCAVRLRDQANAGVAGYVLAHLRGDASPVDQTLQYRNLRSWDGFGLDVRRVDDDTQLRVDSEMTHPRSKIQLAHRVFQAAPALSHGCASTDLESSIQTGAVSTRKVIVDPACYGDRVQSVDRLAEKQWDRFDPGVKQVSVANIVPPWVNGGAPSRDIARSADFLSAIGYEYDGRTWQRRCG